MSSAVPQPRMLVDPRFAALARLLARDLARKHFDQQTCEEELKAGHRAEYDFDPPPEETS